MREQQTLLEGRPSQLSTIFKNPAAKFELVDVEGVDFRGMRDQIGNSGWDRAPI